MNKIPVTLHPIASWQLTSAAGMSFYWRLKVLQGNQVEQVIQSWTWCSCFFSVSGFLFYLLKLDFVFQWRVMAPPGHSSRTGVDPEITKTMAKEKKLKQFPQYGSINGSSASDSCPTCHGTGRIPRGWYCFPLENGFGCVIFSRFFSVFLHFWLTHQTEILVYT